MSKLGVEGLLEGYGETTLHRFYRQVYKATPCGPMVGFRINGIWVYGDDLPSLGLEELLPMVVDGVSVSSIVEGSDDEVPGDKLVGNFDPDDFWKLVEDVNLDASALWEDANSMHFCVTCPDGNRVYGLLVRFDDHPKFFGLEEGQMPDSLEGLPMVHLMEALDMVETIEGSKPVLKETGEGYDSFRYKRKTVVETNGFTIAEVEAQS